MRFSLGLGDGGRANGERDLDLGVVCSSVGDRTRDPAGGLVSIPELDLDL